MSLKYPADVVILHQMRRAAWTPSPSMFPLKLETFLRMAKIPYQNDFTEQLSSKSKTPWITYNGVDIADSQFCIEYLKKQLNIDVNSHLTREERAIARSFLKMTEDSFYWTIVQWKWVRTVDQTLKSPLLRITHDHFRNVFDPKVQLWGQGYGRHTDEEIDQIALADMTALSDFLGKKKFMMGSQPCEEDCSIFAMLVHCKVQLVGSPQEKWILEDFTNLSDYCETMKARFWPDWDDCITHGHTRKALL